MIIRPSLRHSATSKVRKFESLLYKIDACVQKTTLHWVAGRANILCK